METVNQENATNNENQVENKTFTQAELDNIVADRLKRERAKYEGFDELKEKAAKFDEMEEAGKSELQKAQDKVQALEAQIQSINKEKEISQIRTQVAQAKGVPADLCPSLCQVDWVTFRTKKKLAPCLSHLHYI